MIRHYYTALFEEKSTGKVLYRLDYKLMWDKRQGIDENKAMNKFFYEKEKAVQLDKLIRNRFIDKNDVIIKEYEGAI